MVKKKKKKENVKKIVGAGQSFQKRFGSEMRGKGYTIALKKKEGKQSRSTQAIAVQVV